MTIDSLGYTAIASDRLDDWVDFGTGLLGMQLAERTSSTLVFRMDDRRRRLVVTREGTGHVFGWQANDATAVAALAARLDARGHVVRPLSPAECEARAVAGGIAFVDPVGARLEVFHGAETTDEPFRPGRPLTGFRTGALGLGHAVLHVPRIDAVWDFYVDTLGFRLSDHIPSPYRVFFFHVNSRHHSLALVESGETGIHHVMVELCALDDVGKAWDIAKDRPQGIVSTLGRHINDHMMSFYHRCPDGFAFEVGWGGRSIDPATWRPEVVVHGASFWGHDRPWLPDLQRHEIRGLRDRVAAEGLWGTIHPTAGTFEPTPETPAIPLVAPRAAVDG